jgi:dihydroflavonol-4-reductase
MDCALVTGGTGFVGANLVRCLLGKGLRVRALARKGADARNLAGLPVEIVEGDLLDRASLKRACRGARFVFNVAADYRLWAPDPRGLYAVNVDGAANAVSAAAEASVERIVHCSSVAAVRPPHGEGAPASDETSEYPGPGEIVGDYKKSKWLGERAVLELAARGVPVVVVNPSTPIGPYDVKPTPTGRIVVDFLNRRMPSYVDTGLNVVHVRDVAQGHWLAALKGRPGERYILGGRNLTLKEILDLLADISGLPAPRFKTPYCVALAYAGVETARARVFGGEPRASVDAVRMARRRMFYDSRKAESELGYRWGPARGAFEDAVAWFRANGYAPSS